LIAESKLLITSLKINVSKSKLLIILSSSCSIVCLLHIEGREPHTATTSGLQKVDFFRIAVCLNYHRNVIVLTAEVRPDDLATYVSASEENDIKSLGFLNELIGSDLNGGPELCHLLRGFELVASSLGLLDLLANLINPVLDELLRIWLIHGASEMEFVITSLHQQQKAWNIVFVSKLNHHLVEVKVQTSLKYIVSSFFSSLVEHQLSIFKRNIVFLEPVVGLLVQEAMLAFMLVIVSSSSHVVQ